MCVTMQGQVTQLKPRHIPSEVSVYGSGKSVIPAFSLGNSFPPFYFAMREIPDFGLELP